MVRIQPRTQALWFVYVRTWNDQIDPRGPRKGHASHRTTHSAWVRGWFVSKYREFLKFCWYKWAKETHQIFGLWTFKLMPSIYLID
jgi:hypothetical protein